MFYAIYKFIKYKVNIFGLQMLKQIWLILIFKKCSEFNRLDNLFNTLMILSNINHFV